jgi:hypothetical protein
MTATITEGWHVYAQQQPESGVAVPTTVSLTNNPLIIPIGQPKEEGKLIKFLYKEVGIEQNQYENQVSFIQTFRIKANVRTNISGKIHYQVCTEHECLPAADVPFSIEVFHDDHPQTTQLMLMDKQYFFKIRQITTALMADWPNCCLSFAL